MAKPDPKLSDMPPHIKQSIVDDSNTGTKLSLRGINKQFKEVVEKSAINYERLQLVLGINTIELILQKTWNVVYQVFKPTEMGYVMKQGSKTIKTGEGDYRKAAVAKMLSVFKTSKVTMRELIFRISDDIIRITVDSLNYRQYQFEKDWTVIFEEIERILSLKNFRLKIGKLDIFPLRKVQLMSILPHLEPGILKALRVSGCDLTTTPAFDDQLIVDTDQWRQLEEKVDLRITSRATGTMKTVLEKVLQSPTIKICRLQCPEPDVFDMTGVKQYVDQFEKIEGHGWVTYIKNPYEAGKEIKIKIILTETLENGRTEAEIEKKSWDYGTWVKNPYEAGERVRIFINDYDDRLYINKFF